MIVNPDAAIAVENKKVAHDISQFLWRLVIFDVGKVELGGDLENSHHGGKEGSFWDAEAFASFQNFAGGIIFGVGKRGVGVVLDLVSNKKEDGFDLFTGLVDPFNKFFGVVAKGLIADINKGSFL